jgi:hypothetical protein
MWCKGIKNQIGKTCNRNNSDKNAAVVLMAVTYRVTYLKKLGNKKTDLKKIDR